MSSKNQTKIVADPGKYDMTIIREFDAPRETVERDAKAFIESLVSKSLVDGPPASAPA